VESVVGKIEFDEIGNWKERRVLMVQFQGVDGSGLDQFRKAGKQVVVDPANYKSGNLIPFMEARKA
jgi:branched-chain amino acid transport system substrate-binding protein